jgi:hypothetical protein
MLARQRSPPWVRRWFFRLLLLNLLLLALGQAVSLDGTSTTVVGTAFGNQVAAEPVVLVGAAGSRGPPGYAATAAAVPQQQAFSLRNLLAPDRSHDLLRNDHAGAAGKSFVDWNANQPLKMIHALLQNVGMFSSKFPADLSIPSKLLSKLAYSGILNISKFKPSADPEASLPLDLAFNSIDVMGLDTINQTMFQFLQPQADNSLTTVIAFSEFGLKINALLGLPAFGLKSNLTTVVELETLTISTNTALQIGEDLFPCFTKTTDVNFTSFDVSVKIRRIAIGNVTCPSEHEHDDVPPFDTDCNVTTNCLLCQLMQMQNVPEIIANLTRNNNAGYPTYLTPLMQETVRPLINTAIEKALERAVCPPGLKPPPTPPPPRVPLPETGGVVGDVAAAVVCSAYPESNDTIRFIQPDTLPVLEIPNLDFHLAGPNVTLHGLSLALVQVNVSNLLAVNVSNLFTLGAADAFELALSLPGQHELVLDVLVHANMTDDGGTGLSDDDDAAAGHPGHFAIREQHLIVTVGVNDLALDVKGTLAVNQTIGELTLQQAFAAPKACLLGHMEAQQTWLDHLDFGMTLGVGDEDLPLLDVSDGFFGRHFPLLGFLVSSLINIPMMEMNGWSPLPAFFSQSLRGLVNGALGTAIGAAAANLTAACPAYLPPAAGAAAQYVDWGKNPLVTMGARFINDAVGVAGTFLDMGHLLGCLAKTQSGVPGELSLHNLVQVDWNHSGVDALRLSVSGLSVEGLESMYGLELLQPVAGMPSRMEHSLAFGRCPAAAAGSATAGHAAAACRANEPLRLNLTLRSLFDADDGSSHMDDTVTLSVVMESINVTVGTDIDLNEATVLGLKMKQLVHKGCLLSAVDRLSIPNLAIALGTFNATLPEVHFKPGLNGSAPRWVRMLRDALDTPHWQDELTPLMQQLMGDAARLLLPPVNTLLANKVVGASADRRCHDEPPPPKDADNGVNVGEVSAVVMTGAWAGLLIIGLATHKMNEGKAHGAPGSRYSTTPIATLRKPTPGNNNNNNGRSEPLLGSDRSGVSVTAEQQLKDDITTEQRVRAGAPFWAWPCLASHPHVSTFWAFAIPLLLCVNIVLFVSGNTSLGASVKIRATLIGQVLNTPSLFDFTLANSVQDMWQAGVYPLSIIIAVASGGWPYVKLLLMLFCWFTSPMKLHKRRRERLLMVVDALGKWSLIDAYVLIMMMVAFRFHIANPTGGASLPEEFLIMDVLVVAGWGFYGFLLATVSSLVLSHVMVHLHRKAADGDIADLDAIADGGAHSVSSRGDHVAAALDDGKVRSVVVVVVVVLSQPLRHSLCSSVVVLAASHSPSRIVPPVHPPTAHQVEALSQHTFIAKAVRYQFTLPGRMLVTVALLVAGAIIVFGSVISSFSFEFQGAAGLAIGDKSTASYSVFSLSSEIPAAAPDPTDAGVKIIQITFLVFTFIVPMLFIASLLALWLVPLKLESQRRLFTLCEVFNAWAAIDVFCISIITALVEISQFAQFIVGDNCDLVNLYLKKYFLPLFPDEAQAQCFNVIATLNQGCWALFGAAVVCLFFSQVVMQACHKAIRERVFKARGHHALAEGLTGRESEQGQLDGDEMNAAIDGYKRSCFGECVVGCCLSLASAMTSVGLLDMAAMEDWQAPQASQASRGSRRTTSQNKKIEDGSRH